MHSNFLGVAFGAGGKRDLGSVQGPAAAGGVGGAGGAGGAVKGETNVEAEESVNDEGESSYQKVAVFGSSGAG